MSPIAVHVSDVSLSATHFKLALTVMLDVLVTAAAADWTMLTATAISLDALMTNPLLPMIAVLTVTLDAPSILKAHDWTSVAATDALLDAVMLNDAAWLTVACAAIVLDAEAENAALEMRMAAADAVLLPETAKAPRLTPRE